MAVAESMKPDGSERGRAVAIIGDGALTGGMAFEGLNNAGNLNVPLIVVLNDNEMSIAPNVGAISKYLDRVRTDPRYNRAKPRVASGSRASCHRATSDRVRASAGRTPSRSSSTTP